MNDNARQRLSTTASHRGVAVTWHRLDRLASAAALGVVLASPQAALLMVRVLGPPSPRSTPTSSTPTPAATQAPEQEVR